MTDLRFSIRQSYPARFDVFHRRPASATVQQSVWPRPSGLSGVFYHCLGRSSVALFGVSVRSGHPLVVCPVISCPAHTAFCPALPSLSFRPFDSLYLAISCISLSFVFVTWPCSVTACCCSASVTGRLFGHRAGQFLVGIVSDQPPSGSFYFYFYLFIFFRHFPTLVVPAMSVCVSDV